MGGFMLTKKQLFDYISDKYGEPYKSNDAYEAYKEVYNLTDGIKINEMRKIVNMSPKARLLYRYALASNGKELTPKQLDQYLLAIETALLNHI
jgi:hypothetical protein